MSFFSKKLSNTEVKYSAFDRELLAAFSTIRHFRFMLEGREFTLFTDHKPLTSALFRSSPPWSAQQQRHLSYMAEFTNNIIHLPGDQNIVADALSRPVAPLLSPDPLMPPIPPMPPTPLHSHKDFPSYQRFASLQNDCPSVRWMISSPSLKVVQIPIQDVSLLCDVSTGSPRPLVPESLHYEVFLSLHQISHPGIRGTRRLMSTRFVGHLWPRISVHGPDHVSFVRKTKFKPTFMLPFNTFLSQLGDSPTCM